MTTNAPPDLEAQHRKLVRIFDYIARRADEGDERPGDAVWDVAAEALEEHMAREDRLFASLEGHSAERDEILGRLRADHEALRRSLLDLGLLVQLHAASPGRLADLVGQLRAHTELEEATLYRWLADESARVAPTPSSVRAGAAIGAVTGAACALPAGPLAMLGGAGVGATLGAVLAHELDAPGVPRGTAR